MPERRSIWHMNVSDIIFRRRQIPLRDLAVFCRKSAFLLDAGLPLKQAMSILVQQSAIGATSNVHTRIMQGENFSRALEENNFPAFMCAYIKIGERTARLPEACTRLADYYEARAQSESELTAAMLYPAVVTIIMLVVVVLAIVLVLPGYAQIFDASGVALPALTYALLAASDFLTTNALVLLGGLLAVIFLTVGLFRTKKGREISARIKLKIPIVRLNANMNITQPLSLLLLSGESISAAIPMCAEITQNPIVREDLHHLAAQVNSGVTFSETLAEIPYIDPLFTELSRVGEDIGRLPQTIEKCNTYLQDSYRHSLRRINKLIEPAVTLVLGVVLAAIMLAIILPTFELAMVV